MCIHIIQCAVPTSHMARDMRAWASARLSPGLGAGCGNNRAYFTVKRRYYCLLYGVRFTHIGGCYAFYVVVSWGCQRNLAHTTIDRQSQ